MRVPRVAALRCTVNIWSPRVLLVRFFLVLLELDFDVHAGRQVELAQRVDGLLGWFEHVEQSLVGPDLKVLSGLLVNVRRAIHRETFDPGRQRDWSGDSATGAPNSIDDLAHRLVQQPVIVRLQPYPDLIVHPVSHSSDSGFSTPRYLRFKRVLALPASVIVVYFRIFETTPAPTVRPPSRIAKRKPCSIAIGVISSPTALMLSPGITISVPSASVSTPVTSVVRK